MARTPSAMIELGTEAPDFLLPDVVSGRQLGLKDISSSVATVVMFICNHCPFVKHVQAELVRLADDYAPKGIGFVAISSNDVVAYPADSPDKMKEYAQQVGFDFPYLYDETQDVARRYQATCTPDFFVFDRELRCVYRGQLDDSRPDNGIPLSGEDLRAALEALLNNKPVIALQKPSIGCNIKWKN